MGLTSDMDQRLGKRLKKIEEHLDFLKGIETEYLYLDAHKKVLFSSLYCVAPYKSIADREAWAYSTSEWGDFIKGLVKKEAEYNSERRRHELLTKAFDAEYLTAKLEQPVIKRLGPIT